jgi:hypothetical protein
MKKLPVCDSLLDGKKELNTWEFCAPAFIASTFFGTLICKDSDLIFKEFDESSVRSGTLTFVSYKGECFAITCKHVVDALEKKQAAWKEEQREKYQNEPDFDGYQLFTPIGNNQYHFNYNLTPVPVREDGAQPDVAIARVNRQSITRLGRRQITLAKKNSLPETGIASGYPEEQRIIRQGNNINTFSPKFTTCVATLQITGKGDVLVQDTIANHNGLDVLSGMSGGPIIWSDSKRFGLAGIVREGLDIQPKQGQLMVENGIWIHGERITTELFDEWLNTTPAITELKDETKSLCIPESVKKSV